MILSSFCTQFNKFFSNYRFFVFSIASSNASPRELSATRAPTYVLEPITQIRSSLWITVLISGMIIG